MLQATVQENGLCMRVRDLLVATRKGMLSSLEILYIIIIIIFTIT